MLNESYVKTIHFTRRVYTHYLVMVRESELWQNTVILQNFQQNLTQDLRQKQLFAWNKWWRWAFCLLC